MATDIIGMAEAALYRLMSWMSPSWPIGAFAHSGGLEWAVEHRLVGDRASATAWIHDLLAHGPLWNDAVTFVHAWRAAARGDGAALADVAELGAASLTGHERRLESTAQGAAFRRIARATAMPAMDGEKPGYADLLAGIGDDDLTYPVAAATLFALHAIALPQALTAFLHGGVANLVSAAQRLVPLGQTDGQHIVSDLGERVLALVERACALPEDGDPFAAMAGATLLAELGCMAHETQYTRLFRT